MSINVFYSLLKVRVNVISVNTKKYYTWRGFCKYDSKLESNTKLTHVFLKLWLASFIHKVQIIHENVIIFFFFFSKMHILLYHPHLPQVFTILPLPSIYQPPWTTNLKFLMHLKIDLHSFFLNSYELKKTTLSLFLHIHKKNPEF